MEKATQATENFAPSIPLVALVGPTNVGKSTLFNRLTGSWQAITAREESTTRDRIYGEVEWQGKQFGLVDTGGLAQDDSELYQRIKEQTLTAVEEADIVLFVFDIRTGLQSSDLRFLKTLRQHKNVWLIANKTDSSHQHQLETYEYLKLPVFTVSGISGKGVGDLLEELTAALPPTVLESPKHPLIALVGRPNVGKSTLLNALTKSNRAVVSPVAGTTRDIVTGELELDGQTYLLADTAGVRRRGRIARGPEDFSVKRTLAAISQSDGVLVLIDATEGTTRGDLHLIYFAHELKKPLLLIINKMDLVPEKHIPFYRYLSKFSHVAISALEGVNVEKVAEWVQENLSSTPRDEKDQVQGEGKTT